MATNYPIPAGEDVQTFRLEQSKALCVEITENVKETRLLERYVVIGMAAYWAFLIKDGKVPLTGKNYSEWILIPALLAILGGLRCIALLARLTLMGTFLRGIEKSMRLEGWETFLHNSQRRGAKPFLTTGTLIWACIFLMSIMVPILFHYFGFVPSAGPSQGL